MVPEGSCGRHEPREPNEESPCWETPHPGRDERESRVCSFKQRAPAPIASNTSWSSDCADRCLDSICLLRSDRDPWRTRTPAKGRRGVEWVEVLSIGGLGSRVRDESRGSLELGPLSLSRRATHITFLTPRLDSFARVKGKRRVDRVPERASGEEAQRAREGMPEGTQARRALQ